MRNYLSVFSLLIKRSFGKIMTLLLLLTSVQSLWFIRNLSSDNANQNEFMDGEGIYYLLGIEKILENDEILIGLSAVGFIILTILLCLMGCEFSDKQGYTLRRMNITEKQVFICQSIYSTAVYGIFIMLQAAMFYAFCLIYVDFADGHQNAFEGLISNQTVFLAFYRSDILHALMPLDDILKHISNLTMITVLGMATASVSYFARRKKTFIETFILIPVILLNYATNWTEMTYELIIIGVSLFIMGILITRISTEEQAYDR